MVNNRADRGETEVRVSTGSTTSPSGSPPANNRACCICGKCDGIRLKGVDCRDNPIWICLQCIKVIG